MKRIGVFTSGGDAPGMNACIRSVTRTAIAHGLEVVGIQRGYQGMLDNDMIPLYRKSVANIIQKGGTILKTARCEEFLSEEGRAKAADNLMRIGVQGLVCIGGNGSYAGALALSKEHGIPCIGLPGTIDNDLYGTDQTIGFDTAVNTALDAIDKIRDTADSHNRVFMVEVMGRHSGYIGLHVGIAGGAEGILLPELKDDYAQVLEHFKNEDRRTKSFSIIVVAEGDEQGGAAAISKQLKEKYPDLDVKTTILGHIQRGGSPTAADRVLSSRLGHSAVEALLAGKSRIALGIISNKVNETPIEDAITKAKHFNPALIRMADILAQ